LPSNPELTDDKLSKLMLLSQQGDKASYKLLLAECQNTVTAYLRKRLGSSSDVDDLVQETLLAIHKARHTYDPLRNFSSWMITIAKYKYVDHLRKWKSKTSKETVDEQILNNLMDHNDKTGSDPDLAASIDEALNSLSEKQRTLVVCLKIDGLSVKETAEKNHMSEANVKTTAHRAYKALRKILRDYHE